MGWPKCNATLDNEKSMPGVRMRVGGLGADQYAVNEVPVWHGMTFHRFGLILSALFGLIAVLVSTYLIWRHATHYLKPWEQRQ